MSGTIYFQEINILEQSNYHKLVQNMLNMVDNEKISELRWDSSPFISENNRNTIREIGNSMRSDE